MSGFGQPVQGDGLILPSVTAPSGLAALHAGVAAKCLIGDTAFDAGPGRERSRSGGPCGFKRIGYCLVGCD